MTNWRIAWRSITRHPAVSLTVFALLVLGIGATTALFSVVYTVVLRPLPYPDSAQLVTLLEASPAGQQKISLAAPARIEDWQRATRTFENISSSYAENVTDTSGAEPERLNGRRVTPRYFAVFRGAPLLGRTFSAAEEGAGGPLAAVISEGLWTRRYLRDPAVVGRRLVLAGKACTIVGVMPANFADPSIDVWIPAQLAPFLMQLRDARFVSGVGRMRRGVTVAQARADLAGVQGALGEQYPRTDRGWSVAVQGLKDARIGASATPLMLLFAAVGTLLLIAVTNLASLMLVHLARRQTEFAVRASLGGTRQQVAASVMREVFILALLGGLAGYGAAVWTTDLLRTLFSDMPRISELRVEWQGLAFAVAVSVLSAVGFGLLPALMSANLHHSSTLLRAGRATESRRQPVRRLLVGVQIAVTMVLLASALLLVRSFYNLSAVDLGFNADRVVVFRVGAAWDEDRTRVGQMQQRLLAEITALPGVEAAGITNFLPVSGAMLRYQVTLEGAASTDETHRLPAGSRTVSGGYLQALHARLNAGTWCPEIPAELKAPQKAMVNRRFVDVYSHGQNVVGRQVRWTDMAGNGAAAEAQIVGVVGDIREDAVDRPPYPYVYSCATAGGWPDPEYVARTDGDPAALLASVRSIVHRVAPSRAVFGVRPLADDLHDTLDRPRSSAHMLLAFSLAALLLAAVGLYGLIAHMVSLRRREIGVRIALGADPGTIVRQIVAGAGRLVGISIVAGLALMLVARFVLRSVVFGVGPLDVPSLIVSALVLGGTSSLAALFAGRRAATVNPLESIRAE